jgi:serine/threonine-protein kinase RsbT
MNATQAGEVEIRSEGDLVTIRKVVREIATEIGFGLTDVTRIVTAASELARNAYVYAGLGVVHWRIVNASGHMGIELVFEDHGPGIVNVEQAMRPGFSTSKGLGLGLPGAKRLMDEMEIQSAANMGTIVTVRKYLKG